MKNFCLPAILCFLCLNLIAETTDYGLYIRTFPHPASEFTGLALEEGKPIRISRKPMSLSFRLWNREEMVFGAVFRIITDKNRTIDLMYTVSENDTRFPQLVICGRPYTLSRTPSLGAWLDVTLTLDPKSGNISLEYDGMTLAEQAPELVSTESLQIFFGICPLVEYELYNIASVSIKDIRISVDGQEIRNWDMRVHNGDTCYDKTGQHMATAINGEWLIDRHTVLKQIYGHNFHGSPSVAFDPATSNFYIATDSREIHVFNCRRGEETQIGVTGGEMAATYPNSMMFIEDGDMLLSWNLDQNIYSYFDFRKRRWENTASPVNPHKEYYWNNTVAWDSRESALVSFGGYGHYQFNNELLISTPSLNPGVQKKRTLREIDPRYSPASALVDSILYIFGGRGCPSGRQEMTQSYYYDLYEVNIRTLQIRQLWKYTGRPEDGDFLPSDTMLYDRENDCFYLFCEQRGGTLMKIDRTRPVIETVSQPLYLEPDAQYMYKNLYLSPEDSKLYAIYMQTQVSKESQVYIYEMNWPPVPLRNEIAPPGRHMEEGTGEKGPALWIILSVLAAVSAGIYVCIRFMRKGRPAGMAAAKKEDSGARDTAETVPEFHNYDFSRSCICFFGGFKVCDSEGNDITDLFTPTLKLLLILLVLYTGKDARGISGNRLIQTLWFDKTEESAKNNRNVYMSKLRSTLDRVGNVKIVNQNGFWSISFGEGTFCDYIEALKLFKKNDHADLERLIELLLRGVMLPNVENDFVDPFKNDFSNTTIDFLSGLLKQSDLPDAFMLRIADSLFSHDFINEDALKVKCSILYRQGKKGLAKTVYDTFCKEYASSLGTSFPVPMLELVKK